MKHPLRGEFVDGDIAPRGFENEAPDIEPPVGNDGEAVEVRARENPAEVGYELALRVEVCDFEWGLTASFDYRIYVSLLRDGQGRGSADRYGADWMALFAQLVDARIVGPELTVGVVDGPGRPVDRDRAHVLVPRHIDLGAVPAVRREL